MHRMTAVLGVCLFATMAAQAQNPQPVKEMEKEARSAVHVACNTGLQDHAIRSAQCGVRLQGHLVNAQ